MSTEQLTAEQKLRQIITGDPFREPDLLHEGPDVVRQLSSGTLPRAWVTFHEEGEQIIVKCAGCKNILGTFPANYEPNATVAALGEMLLAGHENHMPEGWPAMNIANRG